MKKTPLFDWHLAHGAKMVEFGGYSMPVSYQGVLAEHQAVRQDCGLFDISHMGEIYFRGPKALDLVQHLTSNDASGLGDHEAQYSLLMHSQGYAIDDILVYRLSQENFLLCVNAANVSRDWEWIQANNSVGAEIANETESTGMLALQGPKSVQVMEAMGFNLKNIKRFSTQETKLQDIPVLISRTGYTGEEGCEFFFPSDKSLELWEALMEAGKAFGLMPIGLGARDTLRLEKGYVLYGHELNESINPLEAGLGWVIKLQQGPFLGREILQQAKENGLSRKLVGLILEEKGIPREGMKVHAGNREVGTILSGTMSPCLKKGIASAMLSRESTEKTDEFFVDIRGKMKKAKLTKFPFI